MIGGNGAKRISTAEMMKIGTRYPRCWAANPRQLRGVSDDMKVSYIQVAKTQLDRRPIGSQASGFGFVRMTN